MRIKLFAVIFTFLWALLVLGSCSPAATLPASADVAGSTQRPNIVFVIVDDLGRQDVGAYGGDFYETPNMDRLATEGVLFENAYAAHPRCVPSRVAIMSGNYPARFGVPGFQDKSVSKHALPLSAVTFAEQLQEVGYHTGYIGKWHLGKRRGGPEVQGFETSILAGQAGGPPSYFYPFHVVRDGRSPRADRTKKPKPFPIVEGVQDEHLTDRISEEAIGFIEQNKDNPFMLVVANYAVHTPLQGKPNLVEKYESILEARGVGSGGPRWDRDVVVDKTGEVKTVQNNAIYAAMVETADDGLGRIVSKLEELGIEDNTIIILTSDHGGLSSRGLGRNRDLATSNLPFRHGKGWLYDGGTRVPLIVKWPSKIKAGFKSQIQITGTDHYPTILQMAGLPLTPEIHKDGSSYYSALFGEAPDRAPMFWHSPKGRPVQTGDTNSTSIMDGDWKLIDWYSEGQVELFNTKHDPGEARDISAANPQKTREMLAQLQTWRDSVNAGRTDIAEMGSVETAPATVDASSIVVTGALPTVSSVPNGKNILFIAMDDLRPQIGVYGEAMMQTPNLDRLAHQGVQFSRAYSNVPVCGASRASLMSGLRPTNERFLDFKTMTIDDAPNALTMAEFFKNSGYYTSSIGKIYHHLDDAPQGWSEPAWHPHVKGSGGSSRRDYQSAENIKFFQDNGRKGPPYEAANVPDSAYYDGKIRVRAIEKLQELKDQDEPFFLAVGFLKPHLPFNAPQKYWDMYERSSISLADNPFIPEGAPKGALHRWGELRKFEGMPKYPSPMPDEDARTLIHGYYASVSYSDAQVGMVLDELDRLGLAEDTIVVLWGDHGWSLGEHGLWAKHSVFNVANQVPLIIRDPSRTGGKVADGLVELLDLYPTLTELTGLPTPEHLQGRSIASMLDNPDVIVNEAVYMRWHEADMMRTDRYYFTEWRKKDGSVTAQMLYDLETDPDETVDLAQDPAYASIVAQLHDQLEEHIASRE